MIEFICVLTFCVCYILGTIFRSKIDAIIQEHERVTKFQITPALYKYITLQLISLMIGSLAAGIFLAMFV